MTLLDYVAAAVVLGITDSFNPYVLSMVLCLLIFWARVGTTARRIALTGGFTVGAVVVLTFFLVWSEAAFGLEHPAVDRVSSFLPLAVAVTLLVAGYLLFRHWLQGKTQASSPWMPQFLAEDVKAVEENAGIIFCAFILGLAAVTVASLWPKDQNIYIFYYYVYTSANVLLAALFFVLYGLASAFPLLVAWGIIFYIKSSVKARSGFLRVISWARICFSAVFIAVGLGLIYLFIVT